MDFFLKYFFRKRKKIIFAASFNKNFKNNFK